MSEKRLPTTEPSERLPYEAPVIEESATFERMRLECARQTGAGECMDDPDMVANS